MIRDLYSPTLFSPLSVKPTVVLVVIQGECVCATQLGDSWHWNEDWVASSCTQRQLESSPHRTTATTPKYNCNHQRPPSTTHQNLPISSSPPTICHHHHQPTPHRPLRNKKLAEGITLIDIAKRTAGFSGADLENLMNESAILTARRNKKAPEVGWWSWLGLSEVGESWGI